MLLIVLSIISCASICSWAFLRWLIPRLRQKLLDRPNFRSSHHLPTPRGGGIGFVLVSSVASGIGWFFGQTSIITFLPLIALPLGIIGLLDDKYNLPSSLRFVVQLMTAFLLLGVSSIVHGIGFSIAVDNSIFLVVFPLLLIATTAVINFINFMDGMDGLVAGSMAVVLVGLAIQLSAPFPLWALVGALLGFLWWNWSPANVFMGDIGSTFLGAVFAGLVLQGGSWPESLGFLLVATPLLGDASTCVIRRFFAGHSIFHAHRLHLFQRLHQCGWSHAYVSTTYISATTVLVFALIFGGYMYVIFIALFELIIGFLLDQYVAVPFAIASQD